jgi:hypothetical protein
MEDIIAKQPSLYNEMFPELYNLMFPEETGVYSPYIEEGIA